MNNEMDDFTSKVGAPNMYGLIQRLGQRHRSRQASALSHDALHRHHPRPLVPPGELYLLLGVPRRLHDHHHRRQRSLSIDNGLDIQQAADAPRFHHQYLPDRSTSKRSSPPTPADQLKAMGYTTNRLQAADDTSPGLWGDTELIEVDLKTGELLGGHDYRRAFGKAEGY